MKTKQNKTKEHKNNKNKKQNKTNKKQTKTKQIKTIIYLLVRVQALHNELPRYLLKIAVNSLLLSRNIFEFSTLYSEIKWFVISVCFMHKIGIFIV